ncbi:WcaF family extracellular polysaccharide biosynthesis acetyltransferase [Catenovulum agarivorans]|uniref:WcaF family extracellular polysaccharide biosynthesis acetyltransferase n=1 Tax=Catenovulum agarivorans TaxID=1172192 RepID=UPI0002F2CBB8|nr:WcaF family extracellular polysaccharide biosynthesis acetyltransferase [Catenovulum agarivorans]
MVNLSLYDNSEYKPGSKIKILFWIVISRIFFETRFPVPNTLKIKLLLMFGARVKNTIVLKPSIKIKYPWFLTIGDHAWVGENVWIDNLANITIGDHSCISQGAYLLTGNHDYTKETFDLLLGTIDICNGAWVGAKAIVCPNVTIGTNAILAAGSVANKSLENDCIYQGNPAVFKRKRTFK